MTSVYRRIIEKDIGRKLLSHEHVHHKDHNHDNNDPSNLQLCPSPKDHYQEHAWSEQELIDWLIQFMDEFHRWPKVKDCSHPGMPSASTFHRRFGSFSNAIKQARWHLEMMNSECDHQEEIDFADLYPALREEL